MTSMEHQTFSARDVENHVTEALRRQPITDIHTHCYTPKFGASPDPDGLLLWGIDELVTYHYLVAEVYRVVPATSHGAIPYEKFWALSKSEQADHIWQHLFVERSPISEACRGVLTTLGRLGLDPNEKTLEPYRQWFSGQNPDQYVDKVMQLSNVDSLIMTNPVFDDLERSKWEADPNIGDDPRFKAVLRIDPLLHDWPHATQQLARWGYDARRDFSGDTIAQVKRFLTHWIDRMRAVYVAMSLPPSFRYPESPPPGNPPGTSRGNALGPRPATDRFIREILMPVCAERGLPWAMMIGSQRLVNPSLKDAGDMVGKADIQAVVNLCRDFPNNKFLVTMLSRENQHELCVAGRKFGNLMIFGCWWFMNNPSIVEEITRERLELLGTSFIPQHSDARILDQVIYKWEHSRKVIRKCLTDKYMDLIATGFRLTPDHINRDVALLMRENFYGFLS